MLQPNSIFDGTYRVEQVIGHGGCGLVYKAYHLRLQKYVVIKQIYNENSAGTESRREADILKNLHHPYLPQVYDLVYCDDGIYTVMDYIEGADLESYVLKGCTFSEKDLRRWLHQLLEVLDYLHTRTPPILHSDIKPANIMLTKQGNICLIDFNISLDKAQEGAIRGCSEFYGAPEQIELVRCRRDGITTDIRLDARTDLYSLAVSFYTLVTGCIPPANMALRFDAAATARYSPGFLAVLEKGMARDPRRRYRSAKKMLAVLENLKKQEKGYRCYLALQAVSWLTAMLLLSGSIYCMLRGGQATTMQQYRTRLRQLTLVVENGDDALIRRRAEELLQGEAYQKILKSSPQDYSAILHARGDCSYNDGNYAEAAEYYRKALETAAAGDPALPVYYEDAAVALALAGQTAEAQNVLAEAVQNGLDSTHQAMAETAIALKNGDTQACLQAAQKVLNGTDKEAAARACLLAADAVQNDPALQQQWLEAADRSQRTRTGLRRLGEAYCQQAARANRPAEAKALYEKAQGCYAALCAMTAPTSEDRLNLAVVQLSLGNSTAAISTLTALLQEQGENYRAELNLALAYEQAGNDAEAAHYGSLALRHWRNTPQTDREPESSETVQSLLALQKRLNF